MRHWIELFEWSANATTVPDHIAAQQSPIGDVLYHGSRLVLALLILKDNSIETGIQHDDEGDRVSCTRSLVVAKQFMNLDAPGYGVIFSLDWRSLANDYPVHPYADHRMGSDDEKEECVYGTIKPLTKYLRAIYGSPEQLRDACQNSRYVAWGIIEAGCAKDHDDFTDLVEALITHPLFHAI